MQSSVHGVKKRRACRFFGVFCSPLGSLYKLVFRRELVKTPCGPPHTLKPLWTAGARWPETATDGNVCPNGNDCMFPPDETATDGNVRVGATMCRIAGAKRRGDWRGKARGGARCDRRSVVSTRRTARPVAEPAARAERGGVAARVGPAANSCFKMIVE